MIVIIRKRYKTKLIKEIFKAIDTIILFIFFVKISGCVLAFRLSVFVGGKNSLKLN